MISDKNIILELAEVPDLLLRSSYRIFGPVVGHHLNCDGHKFNMWVLDLSFIGWYLLGMLALLIGTLFVMPYVNATKAELYLVLRQNALDNRLCSYEELNIGGY